MCIVTETWLKEEHYVDQGIEDFENQNGLKFIRRDRRDRRGGGVAICYNRKEIDMSRIRLPHTKHEIVGAIGRRVGQRRKVAVLAVYLPPAMKAHQVRRCLKDVNDSLLHIKQKYTDPYIILGGDFNKSDLRQALSDHPDIKPVTTGPTRGTSILDIVATNFNRDLGKSGTTQPIKSVNEIPTDHLTVYAFFKMSRVPSYRIEEYSYYQQTEQGLSLIHI